MRFFCESVFCCGGEDLRDLGREVGGRGREGGEGRERGGLAG